MAGNIIAWVKANLLIVISSVLILILLPTGWFFSNSWNKSIQEAATEAYNKEKRSLSSASTIEYSLPPVLNGEQDLSESRAPNSIVTSFYKEAKEERQRQVSEVVKRGTGFNKADHVVPVDNLLPDPGSQSNLRKQGTRLSELVAGTPEAPSLYTRLLRKLNAGDAPDPATLAASLSQFKSQQQAAYAATSSDGRVSQEQSDLLDADLIKRRLNEYATQAGSIAFYCPRWAIQTAAPETGYSFIPNGIEAARQNGIGYDSITEPLVYTWVWDYWIISDVLKAVAAGNIDASGVALAVPDAPVKHVESIRVQEFKVAADNQPNEFQQDDFGGGRGGRGGTFQATTSEEEPFLSYTGRTSSNDFDVRYVDMTIVASSKDLPAFFDALGKTNYMTVVDMDLSPVDVTEALTRGYYYGDDHVVRAHLKIETVWLRSWTAEFMPQAVRQALGVSLGSGNPDDVDG
ncbi:MAG: hypothetical protein P1U30_01470 [Phycisphaerales bacterium]|nr:hypothetical protein [Phycisphaerales bacterium]